MKTKNKRNEIDINALVYVSFIFGMAYLLFYWLPKEGFI